MRKGLILFTLFLSIVVISCPLVSAGTNAISEANTAQIYVTLMSQTPDPVEPGQVVTVKFKVENHGKQTDEDVIVKINPQYPFKIYSDKAEKNIGKLRSISTGADAVVVEFKLKVDENAVEEETELELHVQINGASISYTDDEFLIDIQTHDAILDITSITSTPEQIAPGETAEIDIIVKNLADSLLKDIKFKLGFESSTIPLAPYQSSSERRIAQLQTNYQNSLTFKVIADPDAVPGLYKVPLNVTYNDEKGNSYSFNDILAVTIGEAPKIKAYIKKSDVLQKGKAGTITIEMANAGSSDLKYLELYLLPSEDYDLVSTSDYFYLGDVDSDDTESEEINIYINKKAKSLSVPIRLKYADANNKPYQQQFDLELNLYSTWTLKKFGLIEPNQSWAYFLFLILVVGGFFLYRSRKKDPKKFAERMDWLRKKIPFLKKKRK